MQCLAVSLASLLATATLTAVAPAAAGEPAEGGRIVSQRCVACHDQQRLLILAARQPSGERMARWESFLPGHYLPIAAERDAVIAWLKDNAGP